MNSLLKQAIIEARRSTYKMQVGCVIFDKNKIISRGHNTAQRSVKHLLKKYQRYPNSIHAEVAAILNAKRDIKGMSLLVVRINAKGQLVLSKPCPNCFSYITFVKIKKIYFSTNDSLQQIDCRKL
ncbi:MAG: deaminase [Candidatus Omnitrophica bacterium]|jgi:deoxycytidylate deaminase|nr:deaminase [Candidatus Omnitrophota bacterium]